MRNKDFKIGDNVLCKVDTYPYEKGCLYNIINMIGKDILIDVNNSEHSKYNAFTFITSRWFDNGSSEIKLKFDDYFYTKEELSRLERKKKLEALFKSEE